MTNKRSGQQKKSDKVVHLGLTRNSYWSIHYVTEVEMSKSFVWGFIVGVALLIVAGVGASRLQDKNAVVKERNEKQYQIEIADATPVQPGALTEKQRFHSQLFNGDGMPGSGKTI